MLQFFARLMRRNLTEHVADHGALPNNPLTGLEFVARD